MTTTLGTGAVRAKLRRFINHTITELVIGVLIVASIVLTVVEVKLPDHPWHEYFGCAADIINMIFIVELTIRWYTEIHRINFFKKFWIDIIAVMPLLPTLRVLRIVRLLRLIRLGIVFTRRTRRVAAVINKSLAENMMIVVTLVIVFLIGAIGMNLVEKGMDAEHSVWYSLFTLMGGEPILGTPKTVGGKIITMIVMLGGFTMFAIFTGVVSAVMIERLRGGMDLKDLELEEVTDHYIICGWNRTAPTIIKELQASRETRNTPIVVVAEFEEEPELTIPEINRSRLFFISGDFSSTETLRKIRVQHAQRALFLADKVKPRSDQDRDARTILAALTIEKMRNGTNDGKGAIYSCVELLRRDEQKVQVLKMAGVEDIVEGDEYMGNLIAHTTRAFGLVQVIDELLTSTWGNEFVRKPLPENLRGSTYLDALRVCKKSADELIIAVISDGQCIVNPPAQTVMRPSDELICVHMEDGGTIQRMASLRVASEPLPAAASEELTLEDVQAHFLICGWNRAAAKILRQLRENSQTRFAPIVVAAELDQPPEELEPYLNDTLTFFVSGDYSSTAILEKIRVRKARTAILLADKSKQRSDQDRDARTILAALTIEKMNADIHSCAELLNRDEEKVKLLEMANVEDIVVLDEYIGNLMAHASRTQGLVQVMNELLTSNLRNEFRKIRVPDDYVGKTFAEALIACKHEKDALPLAVESRNDGTSMAIEAGEERYYVTNPPHDFKLSRSDSLFVIAEDFQETEVVG